MSDQIAAQVRWRDGEFLWLGVRISKSVLPRFVARLKSLKGRAEPLSLIDAESGWTILLTSSMNLDFFRSGHLSLVKLRDRSAAVELNDLDRDNILAFYEEWESAGVPPSPAVQFSVPVNGRESYAYFTHDAPYDQTEPGAATNRQ